jgi:hypothetical protein
MNQEDSPIETKKQECLSVIDTLFNKYKEDEYMMQRLNTRILHYLSNDLAGDEKRHERNQNRALYLNAEKNIFVQVFLSENKYYYLPSNNFFFYYDGKNYVIVKEDDILHKLLSTISQNTILIEWKHKTKKQIIGRIKERNIFNCIPETETIQNVLNILYPSIFATKQEAKYFLTILGDSLLKKSSQLIILVSSQMKQLLNEIDKISSICFGTCITQQFMTKYHENHSYGNCRLLKIINNFSFDLWKNIILENGLNLLCVATHYSNRYESSDQFLELKADEPLKTYTLFLKNTTQKDIVQQFCDKCLQPTSPLNSNSNAVVIEWKALHFIWKQFLGELCLPNILFSNTLKTILREKFDYDEDKDSFLNLTSQYLPIEKEFLSFWETNIFCKEGDELEMEEICALFRVEDSSPCKKPFLISEDYVLRIVRHFLKNIEIIDNKFFLNVACKNWNKQNDIISSFSFIREKLSVYQEQECFFLSLDEVYENYCFFCKEQKIKWVASKNYFEKFLLAKFSEFFVSNKCIKLELFL